MARIERLLAAGLMLLGCGPAAADAPAPPDEAAAAAPVPAPVVLRVPGDVAVDVLWRDFVATSDLERMSAAYERVASVYTDAPEVDPQRCRDARADIDRALAEVPVGLGLWFASYRCADATGDPARAERDLAAFGVLSRHALDGVRLKGDPETPIRIVHELDAWAVADATGYETTSAAFDVGAGRALPLRMSLVDAEAGRERIFVFDFLDTWVQLARGIPESEFPAFRFALARTYIDARADQPGTPSALTRKIEQAMALAEPKARISALIDLAADDNLAAAAVLGQVCYTTAQATCDARVFDALLPLAEAGHAVPTAVLALALGTGNGVPKDEKAAGILLDRADRRLGDGRGTLFAIGLLWTGGKPTDVPRFMQRRLRRLADDDNLLAGAMDAIAEWVRKPGRPPGRNARERLARAAEAGMPSLAVAYVGMLVASGDPEAARWLQRAAEAGSERAQAFLAQAYEKGELGLPTDPVAARRWREQAAHGGNAESALRVGRELLEEGELARAQGWFESASMLGSADGTVQWALVALRGGDGVAGDARTAVEVLRQVVATDRHVEARSLLADVLATGYGNVPADTVEAARLLRENIADGDARSRVVLARGLLTRRFAAQAGEDGEALLRAAVADGVPDAALELAAAIYLGKTARPDRDEALGLLRKASDGGSRLARNNLAWVRCVSTEADWFRPDDGLEVARGLLEGDDASPAELDTVAACHAANGDFAAAIEVQGRAIARLEAMGVGAEVLARFRDLQERYRRGEPLREAPEAFAGGWGTVPEETPVPAPASGAGADAQRPDG